MKAFSVATDPGSGWVTATSYINGDMSLSRWAWLSTDNGATFTEVFDMADAHPTADQTNSHMHLIVPDPYWNAATPRLWMSYHGTLAGGPTGGLRRVSYSDDAGATWNVLVTDIHPVTATPMPRGVIFGTDNDINGLLMVPRTPDPDDMTVEVLHQIRRNIDGYYGFATKAVVDERGVAHVTFKKDATSGIDLDGLIISTDGINAGESIVVPPDNAAQEVDFTNLVAYKGRLISVYYRDGTAMLARGDAPKRGERPRAADGLAGGTSAPLATAAGLNSTADTRGVAYGPNAEAGTQATALGHGATAPDRGTAIGEGSVVTAPIGTAIGQASSAGEGVAIGWSSRSLLDSTAIGQNADAAGDDAAAIGAGASAAGGGGTSIGHLAVASTTYATAIGFNARATHGVSVALGADTQTTAAEQVQIGGKHLEISEVAWPGYAPANSLRLYAKDNGAGKTQLRIAFSDGAEVVVATQP